MILNAICLGLSVLFGLLSAMLLIQLHGYNERRGYVINQLSYKTILVFTAAIVLTAGASATFAVLFGRGYGLPG